MDSPETFRAYNYVQATPAVATSGLVPIDEFEHIAAAGYRAVINLLPDDSKYAVVNEASVVSGLGMEYVHIPVDIEDPTISDFEKFRSAMNARPGTHVWVHCAANWRVSAFVGLYARLELGWSEAETADWIAKLWKPTPPWVALADAVLSRERRKP